MGYGVSLVLIKGIAMQEEAGAAVAEAVGVRWGVPAVVDEVGLCAEVAFTRPAVVSSGLVVDEYLVGGHVGF